jgi:hypothetical protein
MSWLAFDRRAWRPAIVRASFAAIVCLGGSALATGAPVAKAGPLAQESFNCNEGGNPAPGGQFQCWQLISPASNAAAGGTVQLFLNCAPTGVPVRWSYHWEGAPFTIDNHAIGPEGHRLEVTATNAGSNDGEFWVTGRCRSA